MQGGCLKWELSDMYYLGMLPNADKGFAAWLEENPLTYLFSNAAGRPGTKQSGQLVITYSCAPGQHVSTVSSPFSLFLSAFSCLNYINVRCGFADLLTTAHVTAPSDSASIFPLVPFPGLFCTCNCVT